MSLAERLAVSTFEESISGYPWTIVVAALVLVQAVVRVPKRGAPSSGDAQRGTALALTSTRSSGKRLRTDWEDGHLSVVPPVTKETSPPMTLTFGPILQSTGIQPIETMVIRHAYVRQHEDTGLQGIHADSTHQEILHYTSRQSAKSGIFPAAPPPIWVVFLREGGNRARLWSVLDNHGEVSNDGTLRTFDVGVSEHIADLRNRLVIGWRSPRTWWLRGLTAAAYPVAEIADAEPIPFPGFDRLVLDYAQLQAVMREHRYASWRTALSSVVGVYLITDTRDGRQYVGKADGLENILQRWSSYAANGHGGNVELRTITPDSFYFSLLRVFDPATPTHLINQAESHFKTALDTIKHGLNRN